MSSTLEEKLKKEQEKVAALESLIEERSLALFESKTKSDEFAKFLDAVLTAIPEALLVVRGNLVIRSNPHARGLLGHTIESFKQVEVSKVVSFPENETVPFQGEYNWSTLDGDDIPMWTSTARIQESDDVWLLLGRDLRERKKLEAQLLSSQKLESVGQLAAGVAHEINTPVQFVSDSVHFIKEAHADIEKILHAYRDAGDFIPSEKLKVIKAIEQEADIEFLTEEIPSAVDRSIDGIGRVASIVRAMKEFSHPDTGQKTPFDINKAIENTLIVARGEYKYCANVKLSLDPDVRPIDCYPGQISQVLLNLIVNAAHAITDNNTSGEMGTIFISTKKCEENVEVDIEDTGGGIPEDIIYRIFDPFFTTKEVGKGTGQGLAIARSMIVDKHHGAIWVQNGEHGARFSIVLPYGEEL